MRGPYSPLPLHLHGGFVLSPGMVELGEHNDAQLLVLPVPPLGLPKAPNLMEVGRDDFVSL
jgi:hypothetical protein